MILTMLIWIGMGAALLILALLIVPIRLFIKETVDDREGLDFQMTVDWALGLLSLRMSGGTSAGLYFLGSRLCNFPLTFRKKEKKNKSKKKKPSPLKWLKWFKNNFPPLKQTLKRLANTIFLKGFLSAKIGLADPADTAVLSLIIRPIQFQTRHFNLSLTTIYEYEIIQIRAQIQSTLIIGYLCLSIIGLLLDRQVRRILGSITQTKYKEVSL